MWSSDNRARAGWRASVIAAGLAACATADAAIDLSKLQVTPQHGQSADQVRRDRYECHNWAVEQTGETPSANPAPQQAAADAAKRADRINRIITGAVIGAGLGGFFGAASGHDYNPGEDILKGAGVGAAIGAATGAAHQKKQEAAAPPEPGSNYLRALSACLEGRGYTVAMPTQG